MIVAWVEKDGRSIAIEAFDAAYESNPGKRLTEMVNRLRAIHGVLKITASARSADLIAPHQVAGG